MTVSESCFRCSFWWRHIDDDPWSVVVGLKRHSRLNISQEGALVGCCLTGGLAATLDVLVQPCYAYTEGTKTINVSPVSVFQHHIPAKELRYQNIWTATWRFEGSPRYLSTSSIGHGGREEL